MIALRGWTWVRTAVVVWALLLLGLMLYSAWHPNSHTVYNIYATASLKWWSGEDMYIRGEEYYRYSPLFAILISPLAVLPAQWGTPLWKLVNCLVCAAGLAAWARKVVPATLPRAQVAGLFLLFLPVSANSIYIGQANIIMLGTILLGLAAAREEHWNRAAGWLALATLIKGYPLALALILAALYPRRFASRFAAALALGLLLPFAAQAPGTVVAQYASWLAHLRDSTVIMRERLRSLDHLLQLWHYPISPHAFSLLEVLAGGVVMLLCLGEARRTADPRRVLTRTFVLFALWVALFGPATEAATYAVVAPALAWAILDASRRSAGWPTRLLLVASLLLMEPLRTDLVGPVVRNFANDHGSQPIGALLFLAYALAQTRRPVQDVGTAVVSPERTHGLGTAA